MYHISGVLEGVAPKLFSRFTEEAKESLEKASSGGKFTKEQRVAEAEQLVHRNKDGYICLPAWNLKKCLMNGATAGGLKEGRKSLMPYIAATVFVEGELLFSKNGSGNLTQVDFMHECVGKRPPKTGGACMIRRPALDTGWQLPFRFIVVDDRRNPDQLRRALEEAGLLIGLGSWRPEYGRFIVRDWKVQKD